jgi:hypothetical protein
VTFRKHGRQTLTTIFQPRISRIWHGYPMWEDWHAGMYRSDAPVGEINASRALLADEELLGSAMLRVTREWPNATAHNLSEQALHHRSWLGQSACCLNHGASDKATCEAWWQLSDRQRDQANGVADRIEAEWQWDHAGVLPLWGRDA